MGLVSTLVNGVVGLLVDVLNVVPDLVGVLL